MMDELNKHYQWVRLALLASLVFFLIGLFALVSRWDAAVALIVFACAFRLIAVWLARRRYNAAWMQASATASAEKSMTNVHYTPREEAPSDLLSVLGFTPPISLAPQTQLYHVLRGSLSGLPVTVAETAFVRGKDSSAASFGKAISGILLSAENALPQEEAWVILWHRPFDGLMPLSEFYSAWNYIDTPKGMPPDWTACFTPGGRTDCLEKAAAVLGPYCRDLGVALAARDGRLSLLLPGVFYAQKPDISRSPSEEALQGNAIAGLEVLRKLSARMNPPSCV
ncbi:MAG: hypothetical protein II885_18500 [Oscillospiraceae bacterium]|nr:hypothetical protein [Oscillospiraceae bacterium]